MTAYTYKGNSIRKSFIFLKNFITAYACVRIIHIKLDYSNLLYFVKSKLNTLMKTIIDDAEIKQTQYLIKLWVLFFPAHNLGSWYSSERPNK